MNAGNVELAEQHYHVSAHECHVQVTRTGSVGIEGLVRSELVSRYRASAKNDFDPRRRRLAQLAHEFVVALAVAAEDEPRYTIADFALARGIGRIGIEIGSSVRVPLTTFGRLAARFISHAVTS